MKSYCLYRSLVISHIAAFIDGILDIYWNRAIRRKKQMAFGSICFQVVETEPFKHFFCSCFKVIHDFIKKWY